MAVGLYKGNVPPEESVTQFLQGDDWAQSLQEQVTSVSQAVSRNLQQDRLTPIKVTPSVGACHSCF